MRLPFLRNSPAARSTSNIAKRKVFPAGLLGGLDTAGGSLALRESPRTTWGQSPTALAKRSFAVPSKTCRALLASTPGGGCPHVVRGASCASVGARAYIERRRYNAFVPQPPARPARQRIFKLEAAGILIIGALILIFILARHWHHIGCGVR